jgi:hypothetical protein
VVPAGNAKGYEEVVDDGPYKCRAREWCAACQVKSICREEDNKGRVEPVYLSVPVVYCDGLVLDVKQFRGSGFVFRNAG